MSNSVIVPPIRAPLSAPGVVAGTRRSAAPSIPQTATRDWYLFFDQLVRRMRRLDASVNQGPHSERLDINPGNVPDGALWVETDRGNVVYQVQADEDGEPIWVYLSGTMPAALADKPADLAADDTGFLFYGTDYVHTWRWASSAWEYAPGDRVSGEIAWFASDPGTGWALCNGAATTRTTAAAGTAAFTTPNLIGAYAKGAASYSGAVVPASGSISGTTGSEAGHTHTVTTAAVESGLGDIDSPIYAISAGGGINVRNEWHRHTVPGQTVGSGPGSAHSHGAGSLGLSGVEPQHVDLMPYFRV